MPSKKKKPILPQLETLAPPETTKGTVRDYLQKPKKSSLQPTTRTHQEADSHKPTVRPATPGRDKEEKAEIPIEVASSGPSDHQVSKLASLVLELGRRRNEGLKLYEPLAVQQRFHSSGARERILRGSNRGGKTLPAAIEVSRAVTGQDPFRKWPLENGRFYVVGFDGKHLAEVQYRKLFEAGAFKTIRDKKTGLLRAYRPWEPEDKDREAEAKEAEPLIPERFVKSVAWENKAQKVPIVIRLINGWELNFFSANARPPRGVDVDGFWPDEEIGDVWYPEMRARLLDRRGKMVWSATPQTGNNHLWELHEKADATEDEPDAYTREFFIDLADNPHIEEAEKREFEASITSEEERRVRIKGEFLLTSFRVYPEFDEVVHGYKPEQLPFPPTHWTRYAALDPGHTLCATLFLAVPPPEEDGDRWYVYDELYIRSCTAERWAEEFTRKVGDWPIQELLIDHQAGRQTSLTTGKTNEQHYLEALEKKKWRPVKSGFTWGSSDIKSGLEAVRQSLSVRADGSTRLRFLWERLPNLVGQMKRYHKKKETGSGGNTRVIDEPQQKDCDGPDCLRYLCAFQPRYVKPPKGTPREGPAQRYLRMKRERKIQKEGRNQDCVSLGPSSARGG